MPWLDAVLALLAFGTALLLQPWRLVGLRGPPWPALAWAALLPALWVADRLLATPVLQPLAGACLLVLMLGWPLAILVLAAVAVLAAAAAGLAPPEALHRYVWLGCVPATLALVLGAAARRWLPHQLFVYIFVRGFAVTAVADALAGIAATALRGAPGGLAASDMAIGHWLAAWGDAWLTGILAAIFVAFRPEWLATYSDRIYLPKPPADPPPRDRGRR